MKTEAGKKKRLKGGLFSGRFLKLLSLLVVPTGTKWRHLLFMALKAADTSKLLFAR